MQGIIYTSPRWNELSIGRKQRMKKSLHSSLQNQIRFTAVMVKKRGLSQSSFHVLPKASWPSEFIRAGSTPHGDRGQWTPSAARPETRWHRAIQSNTTGAKGKRAGRELQGKASTAPAYGCSLASWTFGTEEISSQFDSHFWGSMLSVPRRRGTALPYVQQGLGTAPTRTWLAAECGHDLRVPLCFVSAWPSLTWQTRSEKKPLLSN